MDLHQDVKPDRLGKQRRISYSPESDDKECMVKPKYDMDVHILLCIICKNQLSPLVCQCKNNHLACQVCCQKRTKGQCPTCFQPIGRTRNKAIEKMIESLRVPCKHAPNGCERMLNMRNRNQHELYECEFLLLDCPFPSCRFTSCFRQYSFHAERKHKEVRVIPQNVNEELVTFGAFHLDARDEHVVLKACPELFLLHQEDTSLGHMLYVTSCGKDKRYSMEVVINTHAYLERAPNKFKVDIMTCNGQASVLRNFLLIPKQTGPTWRDARCTIFIPQD